MILNNVKIVGNDEPINIRVGDGKIAELSHTAFTGEAGPLTLSFTNAIIFPGLINSHDHLDFNLFPQFDDKTYNNYTQWGKYIHAIYKNEISDILKIPMSLRSEWGMYKNLICGVTTVVNHGERSGLKNVLINIFEESQCLHSVHFEKYWKIKLNNPFKNSMPVAIHVGEGDDWLAFNEIDQLLQYNLLKKKLIGIHGVAMSEKQAKGFEALVWCPESNYFLLNKTAQIDLLKKHTKILFGTDSTLTSSWNIWDHLRLARKTHLLSDIAIYASLNQNAANVWHLNSGSIETGKDADLVIATPQPDKIGFNAFFALDPTDLQLVVYKGNIRLFDETLLPQLQAIDLDKFSTIYIKGSCKYIEGDLPALMKKIKEYQPEVNFPINANELVQL